MRLYDHVLRREDNHVLRTIKFEVGVKGRRGRKGRGRWRLRKKACLFESDMSVLPIKVDFLPSRLRWIWSTSLGGDTIRVKWLGPWHKRMVNLSKGMHPVLIFCSNKSSSGRSILWIRDCCKVEANLWSSLFVDIVGWEQSLWNLSRRDAHEIKILMVSL